MLLRLAGVSIEDIAADYGLSEHNMQPLLGPWVARASTPVPPTHAEALLQAMDAVVIERASK